MMAPDERKLGFVGLGQMGGPMATNLARAGYDLTVFDGRAEAVDAVVSAGAKAARSVRDLVDDGAVVFTSLPSPGRTEQVFTGEDGILASARAGLIAVDLGTSGALLVRRLYEVAVQRQVH